MDFQKNQPIYLQIAEFVFEQILLKKWKEKEKIPSIRELAISVEVNPNTVIRTYAYLEENGIIKMQRGVGFFVTKKACEKIIQIKKKRFLAKELPQIFNTMDLLNIELKEVKRLYGMRKKRKGM